MWPIRGSLYAGGFLIVLQGSAGQCSRRALTERESELFFVKDRIRVFLVFCCIQCQVQPQLFLLCVPLFSSCVSN